MWVFVRIAEISALPRSLSAGIRRTHAEGPRPANRSGAFVKTLSLRWR